MSPLDTLGGGRTDTCLDLSSRTQEIATAAASRVRNRNKNRREMVFGRDGGAQGEEADLMFGSATDNGAKMG